MDFFRVQVIPNENRGEADTFFNSYKKTICVTQQKGVCHEIFDLQFFSMIQTHLGPW